MGLTLGLTFDELKRRKEEREAIEKAGKVRLSDVFEKIRQEWRHESWGCPLDEDLAAYFDGTLQFKRWIAVWWHVHVRRCALCRADRSALRKALRADETPTFAWYKPVLACGFAIIFILHGFVLFQQERIMRRQDSLRMQVKETINEEFKNINLQMQLKEAIDEGFRNITLRMQVKEAINEGFRNIAQLLALMNRARTNEDIIGAAQDFRVIPAVGYGKTYPYPVWRNEPKDLEAIPEGLQKFPELEAYYEGYLKDWTDILLELGDVLAEKGKLDGAIQVFEYLRRVDPNDKPLLFALGELYKMNGDHHKAIAMYEYMISRGMASQDPRPWHFAAWSYFQLGEDEKTLKYYDNALRIYPEYAKLIYNRAILFKKKGKAHLYNENFQRALDLTLLAYQKEGDKNPRIPFTLAILHTEKGELDKALDYLEHALQNDRTYVVRSEKEYAFEVFRESNPYHSRFMALLDHYRIPARRFNMRLEATFEPNIFSE